MEDKLENCPFCKSDDVRERNYPPYEEMGDPYFAIVQCNECKACIIRESDESPEHAHRAAVEAWNRRAHGGTAYMEGDQ